MLRKQLQTDQIVAMKAKNTHVLTTIRYILSEIKNQEIEIKRELNDEEITTLLEKITKKLNQSVEMFQKANRTDLVEENRAQLAIVQKYLPKQLTDSELEAEIKSLAEQNKEAIDTNPKAIIGIAMKELKSRADGQRIMRIIKTLGY